MDWLRVYSTKVWLGFNRFELFESAQYLKCILRTEYVTLVYNVVNYADTMIFSGICIRHDDCLGIVIQFAAWKGRPMSSETL